MEGMPRFPMFAPDIKATNIGFPSDFPLRIKEYILLHFQDDPDNYDQPIKELMLLKERVMNPSASVETACILKRYYAQLLMMKNRFPMEENDEIMHGESSGDDSLFFVWPDRTSDLPHSIGYNDVNYEIANILFNIGAIHANIGAAEKREGEESIKNAFMHFQYAAWPFQQIRDTMNVDKFSTLDFDKDLLTFLVNILLAQAQECLVEKSLIDHRSNDVIAKLSIHLRELYRECTRFLENSSLADAIAASKYKDWIRLCYSKSELYGATAALHMGMKAEDENKYGLRLAYYLKASKHVKSALEILDKDKRADLHATANFIRDVVFIKEQNAQKENDVVYHDRIPKDDELSLNDGLTKVKPLGFDPLDPSVGGEDLFASLLPPTVLKAVSQYEEEKAKLKRSILEKVAAKDIELDQFLRRLRADELPLDENFKMNLPDELLVRNANFNSHPDAFPQLLEKLRQVTILTDRLCNQVADVLRRLNAIDLPSILRDEGYRAIQTEMMRLSEQLQKSKSKNSEAQQRIAAHSDALHLLALPLHEISDRLSTNQFQPSQTPEGIALKKLLDKTSEMSAQRIMLVQRLDDEMRRDNVGKRLLSERDLDNSTTFTRELQKHDETIDFIRKNLTAQEKILGALTEANADFADIRKKIELNDTKRLEKIESMIRAFDVYADVLRIVDAALASNEVTRKRIERVTPAIDAIETEFFAEKERKEAELRAVEERMEKMKMEKETHEALSEYGNMGPAQNFLNSSNVASSSALTANSRRDYMEFFRAKMGGGQPDPMHGYPSPAIPSEPHSPTPSVITNYSSRHSPNPEAQFLNNHPIGGYPQMSPQSGPYPQNVYQQDSGMNSVLPPRQYNQPGSPYVNNESSLPGQYHANLPQGSMIAHQSPVLHHQPNLSAQSGHPHHPAGFYPNSPNNQQQPSYMMPTPSTPPIQQSHPAQIRQVMPNPVNQPHHFQGSIPPQQIHPPQHQNASSMARISHPSTQIPPINGPQQTFQQSQPIHHQPQVQGTFTSIDSQTPIQQPMYQAPHGQTQIQGNFIPSQSQSPIPTQSTMQPIQNHFTPLNSNHLPSQSQPSIPISGQGYLPPSNGYQTQQNQPPIQHLQQGHPVNQTTTQSNLHPMNPGQIPPPIQPAIPSTNQPNRLPINGHQTPIQNNSTPIPYLPPIQSHLSIPPQPIAQIQQTFSSIPSSNLNKNQQQPTQLAEAPWSHGSPNPSRITESPWHSSSNQQSIPQQSSTCPKYEQSSRPIQQPDLFGTIDSNINLPPALQPLPNQNMNENTNLNQSHPSNSSPRLQSLSTTSSVPLPPNMPTAVVAPMLKPNGSSFTNLSQPNNVQMQPQTPPTTKSIQNQMGQTSNGNGQTPVLTMNQDRPSMANNQQSVLRLNEVIDPTRFCLGPDSTNLLEKKILHASFKGDVSKPNLDPNDPLNLLDPFWKANQ